MKRSIAVVCVGALMCAKVVAEEVAPANAPVAVPSQKEAVQPRFAVWEFRVKGNTLLQQTAVELTLTPYLGPDQTFETIQEAASKLERSYRDAGYPTVLVNIPEQDVVGGVVMLEVVEGKVSRVRVSGSRYFLPSEIKQEVGSLQQGQPMHVPSFQADMNRVNSASGDLRVTPVLKPGGTPGTVEVDLRVKDELPLHGSLEVNNHNSLDTTKLRTSASISYDNLWQKHHS
ncbi:MAG TPA: POTRA domain-containing protein, partial [Candidatus Kapabacteria bacterium]|nr:POTRA domain-containing protein [Candidatus Kapabacteria bacterium]